MSHRWYNIQDIDFLDSPSLVIFPERVKENIQLAIHMMEGDVDRLRPHVKTHKSAEAAKLMIDAGIYKFKCATIAEAEMLGLCGAKDVLMAYQPLGPKLARLISLTQKYPRTKYSCLVDNKESAAEQSAGFTKNGIKVPVYIDLNIGMNRTGIIPEEAMSLYEYCSKANGIVMGGLHAYDGHIRNSDIQMRTEECEKAFDRVQTLNQQLVNKGYSVPAIVAGGSPTFPIHAKRKNVECSPGTFIYWDKGYKDLCPDQKFLTAAILVTRVISLPASNRLCLDLGHKSVAPENEITRRVCFLDVNDLLPVGQSEEHMVVEVAEGHTYKTGDVLYALPYHICPTVALYEKVTVVENGRITGEWKNIARDRRINC
jgi:D-threonine aldolase